MGIVLVEQDGVRRRRQSVGITTGAESAVVRRAKTGSKGVVVAYSDQPRAFNAKARLWLGALAEKMSTSD